MHSSDFDNTLTELCKLPLSDIDPYHPPLLITFGLSELPTLHNTNVVYSFDFRKANFSEISSNLSNIDFLSEFSSDNVDDTVTKF